VNQLNTPNTQNVTAGLAYRTTQAAVEDAYYDWQVKR
jgi:hypothetical protein